MANGGRSVADAIREARTKPLPPIPGRGGGPVSPEEERLIRSQMVHRVKVQAVVDDFVDRAGGPSGRVTVPVGRKGKEVTFARVENCEYADGTVAVEVWLDRDSPRKPDFRIFNPPYLVSDFHGDVEISHPQISETGKSAGKAAVRRFREDPLAAIAEAIVTNGGAG